VHFVEGREVLCLGRPTFRGGEERFFPFSFFAAYGVRCIEFLFLSYRCYLGFSEWTVGEAAAIEVYGYGSHVPPLGDDVFRGRSALHPELGSGFIDFSHIPGDAVEL